LNSTLNFRRLLIATSLSLDYDTSFTFLSNLRGSLQGDGLHVDRADYRPDHVKYQRRF
jgi:hypothetical protein